MTPMRGRRTAWWALVIVLTGATVGAATLGGWQWQIKNRQLPPVPSVADQLTDRQRALKAASTGTVKVLSYSPKTLEQDFSAAEALLTGDFLRHYKQLTSQTVGPAAREKAEKTTAWVPHAGVESLTNQQASILVFVNQRRTSRDKPSPTFTASSVHVGLVKVNGTWLIDSFHPVQSP